jgi:hypothetical protein
MVANLPCLTLLAGYGAGAPEPPWDVCYPEDSRILQLISHDTAKRKDPVGVTLVCQARPAWSRHRLEDPPEAWSAEILQEAARVAGSWAARPVWTQTQVWRHARTDQRTELASPILLELPSGQRLGLAGESFAPGGGVEAAFTSGLRLARRLLGKEGQ